MNRSLLRNVRFSFERVWGAFVGVVCLLIGCVIGIFGGISSVEAADDWPQFRGPTGQGISTATHVPLEWNSTKNVKWKTEIPGRGWSSPALSKGRIYLTTAVSRESEPVSLRALAVDAAEWRDRLGRRGFPLEYSYQGCAALKEQSGQSDPHCAGGDEFTFILGIWGLRPSVLMERSSGLKRAELRACSRQWRQPNLDWELTDIQL